MLKSAAHNVVSTTSYVDMHINSVIMLSQLCQVDCSQRKRHNKQCCHTWNFLKTRLNPAKNNRCVCMTGVVRESKGQLLFQCNINSKNDYLYPMMTCIFFVQRTIFFLLLGLKKMYKY